MFLVVGLEVAALLVYWKLDGLVNVDLYSFGLQYSPAWAEQYWSSYRNGLYSVLFSIFLSAGSLLVYDDFDRKNDSFSRSLGVLLSFSPAILAVVELYFVLQVDAIVHGTLYNYGLQFSWKWAGTYWIILRSFIVLIGLAASLSIPLTLLSWWTTKKEKIWLTKLS